MAASSVLFPWGVFETDASVHVIPRDDDGAPRGRHEVSYGCVCEPALRMESLSWPRMLYVHEWMPEDGESDFKETP